ncbi:MAG: shikimate dehydrogenase [Bacteroidetes bacterium]|nr:MAG: shikimate dehydrogenase [Bacteroidota bacterium]
MIDAHTRLVLLFGHPVGHSQSPLMHNTAFRHQRINAVYLAADVLPADLAAAVEGLQAIGGLGANVTIPHKQAMGALMDELSPRARAVGAVNTVVCRPVERRERPRLFGDNTDVPGFLAPLTPYAGVLEGAEMLVFGAGGAARAVVYALLSTYRPARLTLAARRPEQAAALAEDFAAYDDRGALAAVALADAGPAVRTSRLLVNTTPLGMHPNRDGTPWPQAADFQAGQIVYDLVYNPRETRLLREAAAHGATPLGGLDMLVEQAAASYVQWTGRPMPTAIVRRRLQVLEGGAGRGA